jgi:hypothetical protein
MVLRVSRVDSHISTAVSEKHTATNSETPVSTYECKRHNPQEHHQYILHCENLRSDNSMKQNVVQDRRRLILYVKNINNADSQAHPSLHSVLIAEYS